MRSTLATILAIGLLIAHPRAEPVTLRYGQTASTLRSVFSLPIFVAEREGFFAREGLTVTVVPIAGGTDRMIAALDNGQVDITHVSTPFLIRAVLDGSDAVAIAAEFANPIYSLVGRPGLGIEDLRGKTVGLAAAADMVAISTRRLLSIHGVQGSDFTPRELVGTPARFTCLIEGACDAVPLGQPEDFLAVSRGFAVLGLTSDAVSRFQYTVTAARRGWALANRVAVTRYVRALAAAFHFIRDRAHRADVERTIVETTDATPRIAADILRLYLDPDRGVLPRQGEFDQEGLAAVIAFMHETGAIKGALPSPERFIDTTYLKDAGIR